MPAPLPDPLSGSDQPHGSPAGGAREDLEATLFLVRRAQGGSREAMEELCARYHPRLLARVRQRLSPRLRDWLSSTDVAQETFMHAVRCFDRFDMRDDRALIAWLARIAENVIRGAHKEMLHRLPPPPPREAPELAADQSSVVSAVDLKINVETLRRALAALPERQRLLVVLSQDAQLSWKEIAARTGRPSEDAARMAYRDALRALERAYLRLTGEPPRADV